MWSVFNYFPFRWLAKTILFLTGWTPMSKRLATKMKRLEKAVFIFPHSSNWDFVMASLYSIAQPEVYKHIYTVMKPQPFETWIGPYLRSAGFIPSTRREEGGGGFVSNTVKFLETKKRFLLLIAPRGSRDASEWKSGYYWIAKQMQIPIVVVGYDFEYRIPVVDRVFFTDHYENRESMERDLKQTAGNIIPLNDKTSCIELRTHRKPKLINHYKLLCYLFLITNLIFACMSTTKWNC